MTRFILALLAILGLSFPFHELRAQDWGQPIWQDEFNGSLGTPIDTTKWHFERGDLHVNNELEWYCGPAGDPHNQPPCDQNPGGASNAFIDGKGNLVIQAFRITNKTAASSKAWTSARLNTSNNLASFQYGRIESRMKLPLGAGIWPAFWALGTNIDAVGWPNCGEIDYMENVPASAGLGPNVISSTLHGPTYNGANGQGSKYTIPNKDPNGADVSAYHIYGAIWSPNMIQFYVDDPANIFFVRTADDVPGGAAQWAYNHQFYLLLNLAVGGTGSWPGSPDASTPSPAVMTVDWVRAYRASRVPAPIMAPASAITVTAGASATGIVNMTSTSGSGLAYISCSGAPANSTCSIDTGNLFSPHVADFRNATTGSAMVRIVTTNATPKGRSTLLVMATTVSGDSSTASISLNVD